MSRINAFLEENHIFPVDNPAISPDLCLNGQRLLNTLPSAWTELEKAGFEIPPKAIVKIAGEEWQMVIYQKTGESFWLVKNLADAKSFSDTAQGPDGKYFIPHTWKNLIALRNHADRWEADHTLFPVADESLKTYSLGIGARMTTLHWPGVAWAMSQTGLSLTANQNSIPRELVYDVNAMLEDRLSQIDFPFIGGTVPEGHQGQSVQGMSHASVMTYIRHGFHQKKIPWGFNADHQPIGGRFDAIEDELVAGSLFASYITFDLSPELAEIPVPTGDSILSCWQRIPESIREKVITTLSDKHLTVQDVDLQALAGRLYPAMLKTEVRYRKYQQIRTIVFHAQRSQEFIAELSIDELPGLTTPDTLAISLALASAMNLKFHFIAPNIGFQKNCPFADNTLLESRVSELWKICEAFGVSMGFHSGSGKSAENYQVCGRITGAKLEIKTSGRYTYEFGHALAASADATDQQLWLDWYQFCTELAIAGAFSDHEGQKKMAREFITKSVEFAGLESSDLFNNRDDLTARMKSLKPDPEHMHWFEYNFLFVLRSEKGVLGDHSPAGYRQRARFYAISEQAKLNFARNIALYILFLAESTGKLSSDIADSLRSKLNSYAKYSELLNDI